ncbi:hypothetical protein BGZ60DRAFT_414538 [Tricladium varicosporioides]|nr:hypothetical protein BGZ60DRAFT_414538 [Hymenoscyphus varicosporioides]
MYKSTLVSAALLSVASAQSTVHLSLEGFDNTPLIGSIIASNAAATTYSLACATPEATGCDIPPSFTFTQGPSTLHYAYTAIDEEANETIEVGCTITAANTGVCSGLLNGVVGTSTTSRTTTTTVTNMSSEFGDTVVTLTAGAIGSAASSATSTGATSAATGSTSTRKSGSTSATKTTSGSSTLTTSATSVTSGTAAGAASGSSTASGTAGASSSSTAGVPMITGNAGWIVGGAAAALVLAGM